MILIEIYAPLSNLDIKVKIMMSKIKAKVTSLKQHLPIACHFVTAAAKKPLVKGKRSLFLPTGTHGVYTHRITL